MQVRSAEDLADSYDNVAADVSNALTSLSSLMAEANGLLEQSSSPLYGPMPALNTVAIDLRTDGRDLAWRVDWMKTTDAQPIGVSGKVQAYAPTTGGPNGTFDLDAALQDAGLTEEEAARAKQQILAGADFSDTIAAEKARTRNDNMAMFRRMEAQAWTQVEAELSPLDQANQSLDEIRDILDTARQDRDDGWGNKEADGIWSTNDLKAMIDNEHGYYTDEQVEHARTVLAMAESSTDARDYLGISQSDDGWSFSDIGHLTLDIVGMVPVVGNAADGINAAWYAAEGEWLDAALASIALIPGIGQAATLAKPAIKAAASGMVFRNLDEALQWAKRWLENAGILRRGDGVAAGTPNAGALDANWIDPTDRTRQFAANRPDVDPDGMFDVVVHGSPDAVRYDLDGRQIMIDHRVAADLITNDANYTGGPIRLLSCNTGCRSDGFAQNLANRLGVEVTAPDNTLWYWPNGSSAIAPPRNTATGVGPNMSQPGSWQTFQPGGNR